MTSPLRLAIRYPRSRQAATLTVNHSVYPIRKSDVSPFGYEAETSPDDGFGDLHYGGVQDKLLRYRGDNSLLRDDGSSGFAILLELIRSS